VQAKVSITLFYYTGGFAPTRLKKNIQVTKMNLSLSNPL